MYNLPYAYVYALFDMRRITLALMHILIQPPSSYKSSFSYKTSDDAETHDPSAHATGGVACKISLRKAVGHASVRAYTCRGPRYDTQL
jgi:hypothetical protein